MHTEDDVKLRIAKDKPAGSKVHISAEGSAICAVIDNVRRDMQQLQQRLSALTEHQKRSGPA